MGFLLGAFGKQMAGSRFRSIQARMMKIQSRARKAARDVKRMEDMINRQEKAMTNSLTYQANMSKSIAMQNLFNPKVQAAMQAAGGANATSTESLTKEQKQALADYQQGMANLNMGMEQYVTLNKQQIEDYTQYLKDTMLEPLKDEEEMLQSEKDALETELQIARQDCEACKQMEKDGAQIFKPDYTGGGQ